MSRPLFSTDVRGLTLWEPWATLMAHGCKAVETRSWDTSWRGWVAIHSAKRPADLAYCIHNPIIEYLLRQCGYSTEPSALLSMFEARTGHVLALGWLAETAPTGGAAERALLERAWPVPAQGGFSQVRRQAYEQQQGNYDPGRYGWRFEDVYRYRVPVPMRGRQRLWLPSHTELVQLWEELL